MWEKKGYNRFPWLALYLYGTLLRKRSALSFGRRKPFQSPRRAASSFAPRSWLVLSSWGGRRLAKAVERSACRDDLYQIF
jgi:hypothetical protein